MCQYGGIIMTLLEQIECIRLVIERTELRINDTNSINQIIEDYKIGFDEIKKILKGEFDF